MSKTPNEEPIELPAEEELARMMAYAQTDECKAAIARAEAEIAAGKKIVADDAWFKSLRERLAQGRESAQQLAAAGGTDPRAKAPPRRRPSNR